MCARTIHSKGLMLIGEEQYLLVKASRQCASKNLIIIRRSLYLAGDAVKGAE